MAEENAKRRDLYPDANTIITLVVGIYLIVYVVAAWNPAIIYFFLDVAPSDGEGGGKFSLLGTVGDFFGGVINPILTFITIYLLLVSIRIQREELEATRAEMQAATQQAEISARSAKNSVLVSKVSERPFVEFYADDGGYGEIRLDFLNDIFNYERDGVSVDMFVRVENNGRGMAILRKIELEIIGGNGCVVDEISIEKSISLGSNKNKNINMNFNLFSLRNIETRERGGYFEYMEKFYLHIYYIDSFGIEYKASCEIEIYIDRSVRSFGGYRINANEDTYKDFMSIQTQGTD